MANKNNHEQIKQENESLKQQVQQYQNREQVTNVEIYNLNQHIMELERVRADLQVTNQILRNQLQSQQQPDKTK